MIRDCMLTYHIVHTCRLTQSVCHECALGVAAECINSRCARAYMPSIMGVAVLLAYAAFVPAIIPVVFHEIVN